MVTLPTLPERGPLKKYAEAINRLSDVAKSLQINSGLGYTVHRTAHGQTIRIGFKKDAQQPDVISVQRFRIMNVQNDWLECKKLTEDGELDEIDIGTYYVAKPVELRVSRQSGLAAGETGYQFVVSFPSSLSFGNERRLTNQTDNNRYVDEVLTPPYASGAEIYACEPEDKTGVLRQDVRLTWLDLNVDARHYRPKYQRVAVCVQENGQTVTRYLYVAGGPIQS